MPLWKKGQSGNPKGSKPGDGSGRPPDWLRQRCQKLGPRLIGFLESVAFGEPVEQVVNDEGEVIRIPAPVRERTKAAEILLDRGYGRADQHLELNVTNNLSKQSNEAIENAIRITEAQLGCSESGDGVETTQ